MGIRFTTNTWRAPLQLIDCWLPAAPQRPTTPRIMSQVVRHFTRAGWLGRTIDVSAPSANNSMATGNRAIQPPAAHRACHVRVLRSDGASASDRSGPRLVISGRINDVCAELDRLAALEHLAEARHT